MCESQWESVLNSRILANYFKDLCRNFSPPYREASVRINRQKAELNSDVLFFLAQVGRLITEGKIDRETFKEEIKKIKDLNALHVEILWYLDVSNVISLLEFIQFHEKNNEDVIQHVAGKIFEIMLEQRTNPLEVRKKLLVFCIGNILESSKHDTANKSFFQMQMNFIITNLKQVYSENCDIERQLDVAQLSEFLTNFELELVKKFFQVILIGILESLPQTVKSVFKKQEKIRNHVKDKKIYQFFLEMSKFCDLSFMIQHLESILLKPSQGIDWDHMFSFLTFIGVHYKDGWSSLKTLTNVIIKVAVQKLDERILSHSFLIARQGCFEKSNKSFPSYVQWFSSTFSNESRRAINSKKICHFFFNFLTDILPHDPVFYSKVHINRAPWVPPDCQPILHEYIETVKTHLSDLNVSVELGICENTTNKSAAEFDVENVLKHFERTNDILHSVFQTAMFCKDYYEKKFLIELLSKFEGKKSVRHKFITKLHSVGKIPNSLFKAYKGLEKKVNKKI